ncbi:MAG: hypothetical protein MUF54_00075 [Polyangiaceae bacterium]|jgi:hypothetical protein|nr:hypothetical protein [Polyangiaceae bacterium]
MAKALDKTKPFATVHGDLEGRTFLQDDSYFRGDGTLWTGPTELEKKAVDEADAQAKREAAAAAKK